MTIIKFKFTAWHSMARPQVKNRSYNLKIWSVAAVKKWGTADRGSSLSLGCFGMP